MAKWRVLATHTFDLCLEVEAESEEEAKKKAKEQEPHIRAVAEYNPWEVLYDSFNVHHTEHEDMFTYEEEPKGEEDEQQD